MIKIYCGYLEALGFNKSFGNYKPLDICPDVENIISPSDDKFQKWSVEIIVATEKLLRNYELFALNYLDEIKELEDTLSFLIKKINKK